LSADDDVPTKKRITPSSRAVATMQSMYSDELTARRSVITKNRLYIRLAFVIILVMVGVHGLDSQVFVSTVLLAILGLGAFWLFDEFIHISLDRWLALTIQELNEVRISKRVDDEIIRLQYAKTAYLFWRLDMAFRLIEPLFWTIGSALLISFVLARSHLS